MARQCIDYSSGSGEEYTLDLENISLSDSGIIETLAENDTVLPIPQPGPRGDRLLLTSLPNKNDRVCVVCNNKSRLVPTVQLWHPQHCYPYLEAFWKREEKEEANLPQQLF
ncbi:hypothetical protein J6590_031800 [Homalodisca vitripennis]|nr:hypothetical protein J6590_031800 [Homalodisca vitripennis]